MNLEKEASRRNLKLRILVTRLRFLGDIIISTPAIESLKNCYPGAEIYYLAQEEYAPVLRGNPFLDGIIPLKKGIGGTIRAVKAIRRLRFTAALDLFYNPRSANVLFLSGIPIRVGGSRKFRKKLYTDNFSVPAEVRSAIRHHLSALPVLGCRPEAEAVPKVYLSDEELDEAAGIIRDCGLEPDSGSIAAVHPGGTWQAKRWPPGRFASLIDLIAGEDGMGCILITGPGEEEIVENVARLARTKPAVIPALPIRKAGAVMKSAECVIANDGGVMHLSVALGIPTVGVFGPTEPDIWFPYHEMGPFRLATLQLECAPCHRHYCEELDCLKGLGVEDVRRRILEVRGLADG